MNKKLRNKNKENVIDQELEDLDKKYSNEYDNFNKTNTLTYSPVPYPLQEFKIDIVLEDQVRTLTYQ
jgi:hypothetical protein